MARHGDFSVLSELGAVTVGTLSRFWPEDPDIGVCVNGKTVLHAFRLFPEPLLPAASSTAGYFRGTGHLSCSMRGEFSRRA